MDLDTQLEDSLMGLRDGLIQKNADVHRQLYHQTQEPQQQEYEPPSAVVPPPVEPVITKKTASKLVYFSYPMSGYAEQPQWVNPLRQVLSEQGYLIYNPWDNVNRQFGQDDVPVLNSMSLLVTKHTCPILAIPPEVLLPFEKIWEIMESGDKGDNFGIVFQCLWFLVRSSLVICDLTRTMQGAGTAQELLYSKQLEIPVVGLFPTSGRINPFAHRSTTILFSGSDLISLIPIVKGIAPI
jgi:hypothetical protein